MEVSLKELLEAGCHFGHQTVRWHPKMKPYIFAARDGIHIFDLAKTREGLIEGASFINKTIKEGKKVLFVGTKRQANDMILKLAKELDQPYVVERWLGGTLTNWDQMKKRVDKMAQMKQEREAGEYQKFTKRERLLLDREITKLEHFFGGVSQLEKLPDAIFFVDTRKEKAAVAEALAKGIPIVGICDTNSNPSDIDYVIPANDDAQGSIEMILGKIREAVLGGKKTSQEKVEKSQKEKKEKPVKKAVKTKSQV